MTEKQKGIAIIGAMILFFIFFMVSQLFFVSTRDTQKQQAVVTDTQPDNQADTTHSSDDFVENSTDWLTDYSERPEVKDSEALKDLVWSYLVIQDIEGAVNEMNQAFNQHNFANDDELMNWYHDVNLLLNISALSSDAKPNALMSFKSSRFQAVFPALMNPLSLANYIVDADAIIPLNVISQDVLSEELIPESQFIAPTEYLGKLQYQYQDIYVATLRLNQEIVTAYVGVYETGQIRFLGYYGECDTFKTDAYWESNRELFETIPVFSDS